MAKNGPPAWVLASIGGALSLITLESPAQTAPPSSSAQIDAVTVTADRRSGYANTVPASISTYTGDDLRVLGVEDTRELGKIVPGFTFADSGFSVPTYTLRGVGFADSSFTTTSTVGIYNDEVSLAYPIMSKGMNLDLRRVEVVKGPQGTLYGRNATAGAINYVANTPTPYFTNGGEVSYGSYGRVDASGYLSGPIPGFGGDLKGRIAYGIVNSREGWQISQTRPDDRLGKINKQAARALLDWQVADPLTVRFTLSGWLDRSEPQAPFAVALQPQNPFFGLAGLDPTVRNYPVNAANDDPRAAEWNPDRDFRFRDNYWQGSIRPSWDITDDLNLTGIFSYQQVRSDGAVLPQGGLPVDDINDQINAFIRTTSAELRLSGKFGERGDWLLGVNGNYDKQHEVILGLASENSLNILLFGDTPPLNTPIFFEKGGAKSDGTVHSGSVFGDGNFKILDDVKLTLGARYTQEAQDYAGCTFISADNNSLIPFPYFTIASAIRRGLPLPTANDLSSLAALQAYLAGLNPNVPQGACGSIDANGRAGLVTGSLNEHNFSYRSVLSWTPDRNTLLYGSYARGYKSGGFPTVFSVDQRSLAPVVQERLDAYEIGAKWTAWRGRFHVDFSTYYYDYKDKQLLTYFKDPIFGALQYLQNVPKSFNNGAELSMTLIPVKQLYLTAIGSYVRTKVVQYQGLTSQGTAFDFAGQPFNYTPRAQATLIGNYTFALNQDLNITPGVSFSYTGGTNATLEHDPIFAMNAHRVWDARLGLSPPNRRWTVTAYAQNLTNEFYRNSVIKLGDSVFAYTGAPQLYGVSLTYDLGRPKPR